MDAGHAVVLYEAVHHKSFHALLVAFTSTVRRDTMSQDVSSFRIINNGCHMLQAMPSRRTAIVRPPVKIRTRRSEIYLCE